MKDYQIRKSTEQRRKVGRKSNTLSPKSVSCQIDSIHYLYIYTFFVLSIMLQLF
jgi:hypothetical protein